MAGGALDMTDQHADGYLQRPRTSHACRRTSCLTVHRKLDNPRYFTPFGNGAGSILRDSGEMFLADVMSGAAVAATARSAERRACYSSTCRPRPISRLSRFVSHP